MLIVVAALVANSNVAWFVAGIAVAAFLPTIRDSFVTNEYRRLTDAALAEEFTAAELRRLRHDGWKRVDRVEFHDHDVDHVIAGPGGVFVIETKHTNFSWPIVDNRFGNEWANDGVSQARRNADKIRALLSQKLRTSFDVQPILMVWGDGRPKLDTPTTVDHGVVVVTGDLLRRHLSAQPAVLTRDDVDRIAHQLHQFVVGKEALDRTRRLASA